MLRTILTDGNPMLRKKCHPVTRFDRRLTDLLEDLEETLKESEGVGLAAPQIGILRRVAVIDIGEGKLELINPVIIGTEGEQEWQEGCLSIPGKRGLTRRPEKVRVRAQDRNGDFFEKEGEGLLAVALCHELDHLDGKLYTDIVEGPLWEDE
ncbi:MAG: peptide deformylase [Christensenellales bacterium]|jgi:peptide deformylase